MTPEPLACPCCGERFDFGRDCPLCERPLCDLTSSWRDAQRMETCRCGERRERGFLDRIGNAALGLIVFVGFPAVVVGSFVWVLMASLVKMGIAR